LAAHLVGFDGYAVEWPFQRHESIVTLGWHIPLDREGGPYPGGAPKSFPILDALLVMRILGIAGSLRRGSYNRAALRAATLLAPDGVEVDTLELAEIPIFNQDNERNAPAPVLELKRRIRAADAILMVTPEYNYSVPGMLKNAIDWASRPYGDNAWSGKPAAIMGASPGTNGTARAQYHLRQIFVYLNIYPINQPEVMIMDAANRFDSEGNLTHEPTKVMIRKLLEGLVEWTGRISKT
jgi:chromate reductase